MNSPPRKSAQSQRTAELARWLALCLGDLVALLESPPKLAAVT